MKSRTSIYQRGQRGAALIGALLLLFMAAALAVGITYLVMSERKVSGSDAENNSAYYAAEAGMEKMMADLANLYSIRQAPTVAEITNLANFPPALPNVTYPEYSYAFPLGTPGGAPSSQVRNISSGPNAGLVAQIIPLSLQVTAQRPATGQVRMIRNIEVALIPVFQFGVFSDSDLSYFAGPTFDFAGRVHTNSNLFLASSSSLTFHDKVTAVGEVIRAELSNGVSTTSTGRTGPVYIPKSPLGCDGARPSCRDLQENEGSKVAGPTSADTLGWSTLSNTTYNGMLLNWKTGAHPLQLPFVTAGVSANEIIRRPPDGEDPSTAIGQSRLYNKAQIRVLLTDTAAELPGGAGDSENIQLTNSGVYASGVPVSGAANTYFATGLQSKDANWVRPSGVSSTSSWPLINGFLRVEIRKDDGTFMPVTREWLELGFARGLLPPNSAVGRANTVHQNAILIFQMQADRNGDGAISGSSESATVTGSAAQYNWFPINLYDTREGEVRDNNLGVSSMTCAAGGVMNVVELDVRNLKRWLDGTIGTNGTQTENLTQTGYVLYFSDRRGMNPNPSGVKTGEYGWEDIVNPLASGGAPNGTLDSAEDVNGNGELDTYGGANVDAAFGLSGNPTARMTNCTTTGRKNRVTGARHALRLENGTLGNVPTKPDGTGGFTVASEQPVYVLGDYNANSSGWAGAHAASAVITDALTLLSNSWVDYNSFRYPTYRQNRDATQTWYRLAIASGKNMTFQRPSWGAYEDFGTDGGVHNFLRYLEDWGATTSNYKGSLVSFYYSTYGDGIFKCCDSVYNAPGSRAYSFDTDFLDPAKLPPGTPRFQDVVNVGYRQDFIPQ